MRLPWQKKVVRRRLASTIEEDGGYVFRRSRTITGTTSTHIKTVAPAETTHLKTHRLKLHELRQLRRRLLVRLMIVLILGGGCFFLLTQALGFVRQIRFAGQPTNPPRQQYYLDTIHDYLIAHPLEQFSFSLNSTQLSTYVASKHSEVANVTLDEGSQKRFVITFRRPLLAWKTDRGVFYIDVSGTAFTANVFAEPTLKVVDSSGIPASAIGAVASTQFIHFLGQLVAAVNQYGIGPVTEVIIPPNTIKEIDLKLANKPYTIKTNVDRDPLQTGEDIYRSVVYLGRKSMTPTYIDNRVAGKAFYR